MGFKIFFKKKFFIIVNVILFSTILGILVFKIYNSDYFGTNKNINSEYNKQRYKLNEPLNDKIYSKLIPQFQEISDLKLFTDLTDLQIEMLSLMKSKFFILEPDWEKSQQYGKATFEGDFSQILKENDLKPGLKPQYSLGLLQDFPKDQNDQFHNITGYYNFYKLRDYKSSRWCFKLRDDLQFENQTKINNQVVKYSLEKTKEITKILYQNELEELENSISLLPPIIKLLLDTNFYIDNNSNYDFTLIYEKEQDLHSVIQLLNTLTLFSSDIFEKTYSSLNNDIDKSNYGNGDFPFLSYGPYSLKQGYNSEKDWIFEKNEFFYQKDKYPLKNIIYKKTNHEEEKYDLFNKDQINEIIIENIKDFNKIDPNKSKNFLGKTTSDSIYIFFNQEDIKDEDDKILKQQKEKTNFFINDVRFRKALFLAFDRSSLEKKDCLFLTPSFSFVSDITQFTDYHFFNNEEFHKKNLNDVFNLGIQPEQDFNKEINSKIYQPEQACKLLVEVNQDFIKQFPENKQPLIIRIFIGQDEITEFRELELISFLIDSWEKCFTSLPDANKPQFNQIKEGSDNLGIGTGLLRNIKNPHNIFLFLYDQIKIKDSLENFYDRQFVLKDSSNDEKIYSAEELHSFLKGLQKKIDKKNNSNNQNDFEQYCLILAQLEKKALEELYCLPLIKGKKYKFYQVLERDFQNSFLLWGLCDIC